MANFLQVDYKKANQNTVLPAGTYEMYIKNVEVRASKGTNHENMSFDMIVRQDLDKVPELAKTNAKQHGRHLFVSVWTAKDNQGKDSGHYKESDLDNIAKAVGIPDNAVVKTIEDFMNLCKNKCVRVKVGVSENTYNGNTRKQNSCFTNQWSKTKFPLQGSKKQKDPFAGNDTGAEIDDNQLPF